MAERVAVLENASLTIGKQCILNHLQFSLEKGKIYGLIGPSGAGKTTVIQALLGMKKLNHGRAFVFETLMPSRMMLKKIGYMGQTTALYESLSAYENLVFFGRLQKMEKGTLEQSIQRCLRLVQLEKFSKKRVENFSGGMKRRLSLAITLLSSPSLLVLDEPTVGIDPTLRQDIWTELRKLALQGTTILVTTHAMDEAQRCDEVGLIINGKLITQGTPTDLKEQFHAQSIEEVFILAERKEGILS